MQLQRSVWHLVGFGVSVSIVYLSTYVVIAFFELFEWLIQVAILAYSFLSWFSLTAICHWVTILPYCKEATIVFTIYTNKCHHCLFNSNACFLATTANNDDSGIRTHVTAVKGLWLKPLVYIAIFFIMKAVVNPLWCMMCKKYQPDKGWYIISSYFMF